MGLAVAADVPAAVAEAEATFEDPEELALGDELAVVAAKKDTAVANSRAQRAEQALSEAEKERAEAMARLSVARTHLSSGGQALTWAVRQWVRAAGDALRLRSGVARWAQQGVRRALSSWVCLVASRRVARRAACRPSGASSPSGGSSPFRGPLSFRGLLYSF